MKGRGSVKRKRTPRKPIKRRISLGRVPYSVLLAKLRRQTTSPQSIRRIAHEMTRRDTLAENMQWT